MPVVSTITASNAFPESTIFSMTAEKAPSRSPRTVQHMQPLSMTTTCNMTQMQNADVPLASANSDMIRWNRVLLSHTLDAARTY